MIMHQVDSTIRDRGMGDIGDVPDTTATEDALLPAAAMTSMRDTLIFVVILSLIVMAMFALIFFGVP